LISLRPLLSLSLSLCYSLSLSFFLSLSHSLTLYLITTTTSGYRNQIHLPDWKKGSSSQITFTITDLPLSNYNGFWGGKQILEVKLVAALFLTFNFVPPSPALLRIQGIGCCLLFCARLHIIFIFYIHLREIFCRLCYFLLPFFRLHRHPKNVIVAKINSKTSFLIKCIDKSTTENAALMLMSGR
jgi:hypothetical protein